eukprot:GHVT01105020.1.p1 GENE.GHVT01105020.1~~GHVT01105020.1.p1  ORF type:complete len:119 (+),score=18.15 GHVT01105020.1:1159-1515(+)
MVRQVRYPASPLQEIFLPEGVPFFQYDQSRSCPTPPPRPAVDFDEKVRICDSNFSGWQQLRRQSCHGSGDDEAASVGRLEAKASLEYRRCINSIASEVIRNTDPEWTEMRRKFGKNTN